MYDMALDEAYRKGATGIELRTPEEVQKYKDNNNIHTKFPYVWNVWASAVAESGPGGYQFYVWAVYTHRPKEISMKPITYVCRKKADAFPMDGYSDDGLFYKRVPCGDKRTIQTDYETQTPIWWEYGDVKQVMTVWSSDPNFLPEFGYIVTPPDACVTEGYFTSPYGSKEITTDMFYPMVAIRQNSIVNYGSKSRVEIWRYPDGSKLEDATPYYAITINAFNIENCGIRSPHEGSEGQTQIVHKCDPGLNGLEYPSDGLIMRHSLLLGNDGVPTDPYHISDFNYFYKCDPGTKKKSLIDDNIGDQWILHKDNFYKDQFELPESIEPEEIDLSNKKDSRAKLLDICQTNGKYLKLYENNRVAQSDQLDTCDNIGNIEHDSFGYLYGTLYSIYCANNTWIAAGSAKTILRSTDNGLTWTKIESGITTGWLYSASYSNNTWIIVGQSGTILRSTDNGLTWTKINSGVGYILQRVYYSNNTWIVIGTSGTILRSTDDGLTWTRITVSGMSTTLWGISYSNNTWIVVGDAGTILRSTDNGLTWSKINSGVTNVLYGIYYANNTWIIVGNTGTILRSTDDGLTWTKINSGIIYYLRSIYYSNNTWIIVGNSGTILRSTDNGLTWSKIVVEEVNSDNLYSISYSNNTWIIVGNSILRSTDNELNWTKINVSGLNAILQSIHYSNNTWIITGNTSTIFRSTDNGLNWTTITVSGVNGSLNNISYSNNTWIIVGYGGTILHSTDDGLNWTKINVNGVSSSYLYNIYYANNTWIIVGYTGTILRSTDKGLKWSKITVSGVTNDLYDIHYSNNTWIIVGNSGTILRSTDNGLTWSKITVSGVSNNLYGIHYANNTWITVGDSSIILRSTDNGLTWTKINVSVSGTLFYDIHYDNGIWLAVGQLSIILRSTDNGLTWSKIVVEEANSDNLRSIYYSNNTWITVGVRDTILRSTDNGLTWKNAPYFQALQYNINDDIVESLTYAIIVKYASNEISTNFTTAKSAAFQAMTNGDKNAAYTKILDYHNLNGFETRAIETLDGPQLEYRFPGNNEFGWSKKYFNQDGNTWIAICNTNHLLHSTDNGLTWTNITSDTGLTDTLFGIHYANNTWIIVGDNGTILRSTNNGLKWEQIMCEVSTTLENAFYINNTWLVVGTGSVILRSTDNGLTWTSVTTSVGYFDASCIYCNNHTCIIVGYEEDGVVILRSIDDGLTWTRITVSGLTKSIKLIGIYYSNNTWIIVGSIGTILRSTDDGLTWTKINSGVTVYFQSIRYNNNTWIIVGYIGTILRSTDNGLTWTNITVEGVINILHSISYSNNAWIAVGDAGTILRSTDDGLSWTRMTVIGANGNLNGIYCSNTFSLENSGIGYSMAEFSDSNNLDKRYLAVPHNSSILLFNAESKNSNNTKEIPLSEGGFNHVYSRNNDLIAIKNETGYRGGDKWASRAISDFSALTHIYKIGCSETTWLVSGSDSSNVAVIMRSIDHGMSWSKIIVSGYAEISNIRHANGIWMATSNNRVLRSTDDGLTWKNVGISGTSGYINNVQYGNHMWIAVGDNFISYSNDDGVTWKNAAGNVGNLLHHMVYGNGVWIAISTNTVFRSTNNGLTWEHYSEFSDITCYDIDYGNGVFIAVGDTNGSICRSTDNGKTWSYVEFLTKDGNATNIKYGNGVWVATGDWGALAYSIDDGLTWTKISPDFDISGGISTLAYTNGMWVGIYHNANIATSISSIHPIYTINQFNQLSLISGMPTPEVSTYNIPITGININDTQLELFTYNYGIIPIQDNSYALFGYSVRVEENLWKTQYYIINIENQSIVWTNPNLICKTFIKPQSKFISCGGDIIMVLDNDAAGLSTSQISYRIPLKYGDRTVLPLATTIGRYPEDHMYADAYVDHSPQCVYEKTYTSGNVNPANRGKVPYDQKIAKIPGVANTSYTKDRYLIPKPYMANVIEDMKNPNEYDELP